MSMLVDENVPTAVARLFRDRGHKVKLVRIIFARGASDAAIAAWAKRNNAIVLTWNKKHLDPLLSSKRPGGGALFFCCPVANGAERAETFLEIIELEHEMAHGKGVRMMVEIHPRWIVIRR
jgi:hypothetical protein